VTKDQSLPKHDPNKETGSEKVASQQLTLTNTATLGPALSVSDRKLNIIVNF